jgi:hypothetical protein
VNDDTLTLHLSKKDYEALKDVMILDDDVEAMINRATPSSKGFVIEGPWATFDELAGYVAAETNHCKSRKKQDALDSICDEIESLLH